MLNVTLGTQTLPICDRQPLGIAWLEFRTHIPVTRGFQKPKKRSKLGPDQLTNQLYCSVLLLISVGWTRRISNVDPPAAPVGGVSSTLAEMACENPHDPCLTLHSQLDRITPSHTPSDLSSRLRPCFVVFIHPAEMSLLFLVHLNSRGTPQNRLIEAVLRSRTQIEAPTSAPVKTG